MNVQTRIIVRVAALAAVPALAAVVVVGCSGESPSSVPTVHESASAVGSTVVTASEVTASDGGGTVEASDDGRPFGPPEEALTACDQKTESDACSFMSPRDGSAVDGTCQTRWDDPSQLACRPNDWPGRGERGEGQWGPPEEALAACNGVDTGSSCSFEAPFGTVDGTCSEGPGDSGQVVCRPDGGRPDGRGPGRGGQGREAARAACADKQAAATCSFESPFGTISGACRSGRDGSTLVCAPDDWPGR